MGDIVPRFNPKKNRLGDFRFALIGFPEDRGIRRNKGRPGSAKGPTGIRRAFYKLAATELYSKADLRSSHLVDLGDISPAKTLEERQKMLGEVVGACFSEKIFPIVIGGGHETAWGHYLGYPSPPTPLPPGGEGGLHILNIDAHLDMRPLEKGKGHSGSSFRQMIEAGFPGNNLTVFGVQGFCNAEAHLQYAWGQGVNVVWLEDLIKEGVLKGFDRVLQKMKDPLYATFCLDAIRGIEFPATSAAPAEGFTVRAALAMMESLARHPSLTSLDLVEYSPPFDPTGACAKIVALMIYRFLGCRGSLGPDHQTVSI